MDKSLSLHIIYLIGFLVSYLIILLYKIINGLAQVPFEGVLVESYNKKIYNLLSIDYSHSVNIQFDRNLFSALKGTRKKHNMKFRQIGHTTSQYVHYSQYSRFFLKLLVHGMGLLSLKLCHWLYLDQIFLQLACIPSA